MNSKSNKSKKPTKSDTIVAPRFITIRLDQIVKTEVSKDLMWTTQCGYQSNLVPTVRPSALQLIQFTNPMVVVRTQKSSEKDDVYSLIAGRHTYAFHREQLSGTAKVKVLVISDATSLIDPELYDVLVQRLLLAPDATGTVLIAAQLQKDQKLRERVSAYLPVETLNEVSILLGISRQTLHRALERARPLLEELSSGGSKAQAGISVLADGPDEEQA